MKYFSFPRENGLQINLLLKHITFSFYRHSTSSGIDKKNIVQNNGKKIAYVTRTDKNNGIDSFVSIQAKNYDKGNVISIGLDT